MPEMPELCDVKALHDKIDQLLEALEGEKSFDFLIAFDQLCHLFFLKILDEQELGRVSYLGHDQGFHKPLFPLQTERYRWQRWCHLPSEELLAFVRDEVFSYMASLSREDRQVGEHFRDARLLINSSTGFARVVEIISRIEFTRMGHDAGVEFDRYLLERLVQVSAADSSYIKLPPALSRLMLELTQPQAGETVFDPSASVGDLLIAALDHMHINWPSERLSQQDITLSGVEDSRQLVRITKVRLMLHGLWRPSIHHLDLFADQEATHVPGPAQQVILAAPPLKTRTILALAYYQRDRPSDINYLQLCMASLAPGGRCAIVVPDAVLNSISRTAVAVRQHLIQSFNLLAVVKLPRSVLPSTARMNISLLIFRKPLAERAQGTEAAWFYQVDYLHGAATQEFSIQHLISLWQDYQASNFQEPFGPETVARLAPESQPPCCWWAKKEQLAQANYNLDAQIWHPVIEDIHAGDDPETLVNALLTDYQEIVIGLQSLLKEIK